MKTINRIEIYHDITQKLAALYQDNPGDKDTIKCYMILRGVLSSSDEEVENTLVEELKKVSKKENYLVNRFIEVCIEFGLIDKTFKSSVFDNYVIDKYLSTNPKFTLKEIDDIVKTIKTNECKYLNVKSGIKKLQKYYEENQ